jgi:hypothetical protein
MVGWRCQPLGEAGVVGDAVGGQLRRDGVASRQSLARQRRPDCRIVEAAGIARGHGERADMNVIAMRVRQPGKNDRAGLRLCGGGAFLACQCAIAVC